MLIPRNALKAVSLAMAKGGIRYYLNGMLLECNGATVRLVASDGYRLHLMDVPQPVPAEGEPPLPPLAAPVILPRALVDWALKSSKKGQTIELDVIPCPPTESGVVPPALVTASVNGASMTATAIDGKFPDYLRIPPAETSGETAQFNPQYVSDAYAAVCEIADQKHGEVTARLNHNGDGCATMVYERFAAVIMPWRTADETAIDPALLAPL